MILLTNIIFGFFPISFILGNLITNINVVLICIIGIFHLKSKILKLKFSLPIKIIFIFFCAIFFSTLLSLIQSLYLGEYQSYNLNTLVKSVLFFRFFLMFLIVCLLHESNILNFKYFFLTAAFCAIFISLDIIYQYFFDSNIIGMTSPFPDSHNTSFFGDELIAGGYILHFSFFSLFLLTFLLKNKNNLRIIICSILISALGLGILLSGNRMPLFLFLFGLILTFLFDKKLRIVIPLGLIFFFALTYLSFSFKDTMKNKYESLYYRVTHNKIIPRVASILPSDVLSKLPLLEAHLEEMKKVEREEEAKDKSLPEEAYGKWKDYSSSSILLTGLDIWRQNKIFGVGMKTFKKHCHEGQKKYFNTNTNEYSADKRYWHCSNHPHNYYLEILFETGIVGLTIIIIIALIFLKFLLKNFRYFRQENFKNYIIIAAVVSLILEAFPFRSTGSFFSTGNATYIIIISAIILSYKDIIKKSFLK